MTQPILPSDLLDSLDPEFYNEEAPPEEEEELTPAPQGGKVPEPLDEDEIAHAVGQEISSALGDMNSGISEDRRQSLKYYLGKPFGNEQEGRSKVVLHDVLESIEWIIPSLMKIFFGGGNIVNYKPKIPLGALPDAVALAEAQAREATDYINTVFLHELDGFLICHNWFKDALLEKNGIVKCYLDERLEPKVETYRGLSMEEVDLLLADGRVEPVAQSSYSKIFFDPDTQMRETRELFDIEVRNVEKTTRIVVENVPPEEFLISRRSTKLDDYTPFTCHRKLVTVSELISLGYDRDFVLSLPSDDSPEWNSERTERFSDDGIPPLTRYNRVDPASREIWVNDCFMRIDADGDGYSELRRLLVAGETGTQIIDNQMVNRQPFSSLTPIPMPHKFYGLSIADLVRDVQLIRSTLLRQILDNTYYQTNQRMIVTDGVEIEDLLTSRPGGIIRADSIDSISAVVTPPLPPDAYKLLEYMQEVRENRTGVTRYNQGMDAASLNKTAFGVSSIMTAGAARVEQIARIFAETGMKDLFSKLLRLVVEGPLKERVVRLRGEWVTIDPSGWNQDMDVEIEIGMGAGQAQERLNFLGTVAELQEKVAGAPGVGGMLLSPQHVYNTLSKMTETMGFRGAEMFFKDPGNQEPPPPPPDPKALELEAKKEESAAKIEVERAKVEVDANRIEQMHQRGVAELAQERELALARIESNERIALANVSAAFDKIELESRALDQEEKPE